MKKLGNQKVYTFHDFLICLTDDIDSNAISAQMEDQ